MVSPLQLATRNVKKADAAMQRNASVRRGELGAPGTNIISGIISEDFNSDLHFPDSVDIYEEMRSSDGQVHAALQAIKLPLLTANWIIEGGEEVNEEHVEFIKGALFQDMEIPWEHFLSEALSFLDFGFYYFEKVFKTNQDGKIGWRKFAPRIPSAHLYWSSEKFKKGITQQLKTTNPEKPEGMNPQIPWEKLMLFNHEMEGDNYEGRSVLRTAYKHWKMKDLAYKIQIIAIERHGVGIPKLTLPKNAGDTDIDKAEEMLKNLRSNEKAYMILKEGWEFEIVSGGTGGTAKDSQIKDAIDHHNRMILMNVLAPFLDLGSGSTGSFALGETQLNFFLNSLQNIGKNISGVINNAIKELIEINFGAQDFYPMLRATEIGNIDKQIIINAISTAVTSGLIKIDKPLREWTRENLNLPEEDEATVEEPEKKEEKEEVDKKTPDEFSKKKSQKKDTRKFAEKPKTKISESEKIFQSAITEHESKLEGWWKEKYLPEIEKTEKELRVFIGGSYKQAKTDKVGGVNVVATRGNSQLMKDTMKGVDEIMKKLQKKFEQPNYADAMLKDSAKQALKVMVTIDKVRLEEIVVSQSQFNSFKAGHLSNMTGFIFNGGRQNKEKIIDNFTQAASVVLAIKQANEIKLNRNVTKLSITTHPRALFKNTVFTNAELLAKRKQRYKTIIPNDKFRDLNPAGKTALLLFLILTFQQLNKEGNTKNNVNSINGMGAHHGSFDYAYPIDEENYAEEERIAEEQRKEFLNSVK